MSDDIPEAGAPSLMPREVERRLTRFEQGLGAIIITLATTGVLAGIAGKTELEVLSTRVQVLERTEQDRADARSEELEREREAAERLVRIEAKVEATLDRVTRVEAEMRRERDR